MVALSHYERTTDIDRLEAPFVSMHGKNATNDLGSPSKAPLLLHRTNDNTIPEEAHS